MSGGRALLVALALAAAVLAGIGLVIWNTISVSPTPEWSLTELETQARAGHVKQVEVSGDTATAVDGAGRRHSVRLPPDTAPVAQELVQDGVDVRYVVSPGGGGLSAALPNLLLLVLVAAGVVGILYFVVRRPRR